MSVTLATIADALIEFILSLLRDPDAAAEFDADPEAALSSRGLANTTAADVCAVAPVIAERAGVTPAAAAKTPVPVEPDSPVVREIKTITNSLTYVDNHNTIVDQSVNQNIWAGGDVTQVFDNEAVVASGEDSVAAGDDATIDNSLDNSTNIDAGDDVLIDSTGSETTTTDSQNTTTDTTTVTDASETTTTTDSGNTATETETVDDSYNDTTVDYTEQTTDTDATTVFESSDVVIEETPSDDF